MYHELRKRGTSLAKPLLQGSRFCRQGRAARSVLETCRQLGLTMLTNDQQDWVARARELARMIEAAAGRTETERKIPADVLSAMHEAGLFHILLPASLGGGAVDLVTFNQVVEAIAAADASPAWCLAQAVASSHTAGFLDPVIAQEVFGARDALVAWGPPAGIAKAVAVDGGYRVTGKWRLASGSANATWMGGHSTFV